MNSKGRRGAKRMAQFIRSGVEAESLVRSAESRAAIAAERLAVAEKRLAESLERVCELERYLQEAADGYQQMLRQQMTAQDEVGALLSARDAQNVEMRDLWEKVRMAEAGRLAAEAIRDQVLREDHDAKSLRTRLAAKSAEIADLHQRISELRKMNHELAKFVPRKIA